jgi:hypothetical protein
MSFINPNDESGDVAEPFSNEYLAIKELVARPACFRDILQPPITDSLCFASFQALKGSM